MYNNYNANMQSANINKYNIYVKRFMVIETRKKYEDVYKRTHNLEMSNSKLYELEKFFQTRQTRLGNSISSLDLASAVPDIVNVNSVPIGEANIVNGWGTPRLRFLLVIESPTTPDISKEYYIQGYSEYLDPSAVGRLDPNMRFHINSIINVVRYRDPITGALTASIESTSNVITKGHGYGYEEVLEPRPLKLVRPIDIFNGVNGMNDNDGSIILDSQSNIENEGKSSARANNDGLNYFVDIANKFISNQVNGSISSDVRDTFKNCISESAEPALIKNGFLAALSTVTGIIPPTSFTINELDMINPNYTPDYHASNHSNIVGGFNMYDPTQSMLNTDITETMHQATVEVKTATKISQTLTAYMAQNHIGHMHAIMSNLNGIPTVQVFCKLLVENITDDIIILKTNIIKNNIEKILFREISMNNTILLDATVEADMFGDTTVSLNMRLGYGGNNHKIYRFPTFADSLYIPVVADQTTSGVLVQDFNNVIETLIHI